MRKTLLFVSIATLAVCVCACGGNGNKSGNKAASQSAEAIASEEDFLSDLFEEEPVFEETRVYCKAFDGFFNLREKPDISSQRIGKFYNGPEGAIVLEDDEEAVEGWIKVDVDGVIGYVHEAYVQDTPTARYTGDVDPSWVQGAWIDGYDILFLYDSGFWAFTSDGECLSYGIYRLQNEDKVAFETAWSAQDDFDDELTFDTAAQSIGGFYKVSPMGSYESSLYKKFRKPFYDVAAELKNRPKKTFTPVKSAVSDEPAVQEEPAVEEAPVVLDNSSDAAFLKSATKKLQQFKKEMDGVKSGKEFRRVLNAYNQFVKEIPDRINNLYDNELMEIDGGEAYLDAIDDFMESFYKAKEKYGEDYL